MYEPLETIQPRKSRTYLDSKSKSRKVIKA